MGEKELREYLRELGRRGGQARAKNLTEQEASNIGKKAAAARWSSKRLEKSVAKIEEGVKELKKSSTARKRRKPTKQAKGE